MAIPLHGGSPVPFPCPIHGGPLSSLPSNLHVRGQLLLPLPLHGAALSPTLSSPTWLGLCPTCPGQQWGVPCPPAVTLPVLLLPGVSPLALPTRLHGRPLSLCPAPSKDRPLSPPSPLHGGSSVAPALPPPSGVPCLPTHSPSMAGPCPPRLAPLWRSFPVLSHHSQVSERVGSGPQCSPVLPPGRVSTVCA